MRGMIEMRGRRQTITTWARELGVGEKTVEKRLEEGYPIDRVFIPGQVPRPTEWLPTDVVWYDDELQSITDWALDYGILPELMRTDGASAELSPSLWRWPKARSFLSQ